MTAYTVFYCTAHGQGLVVEGEHNWGPSDAGLFARDAICGAGICHCDRFGVLREGDVAACTAKDEGYYSRRNQGWEVRYYADNVYRADGTPIECPPAWLQDYFRRK